MKPCRPAIALGLVLLLQGCFGDDGPGSPAEEEFPPPQEFGIDVPGFPGMPVPEDNPLTRQGVALGRRLFYDPILSRDSTQSCSTCHTQEFAFSDSGRRFSVGVDGTEGARNAPSVINVAWNKALFWDGRAQTLEEQAVQPVINPIEMDETWDRVVAKLRRSPTYLDLFGEAFGTRQITRERVVKAIAQFERTLVSNNSKYDRSLRNEVTLSDAEQRGRIFFLSEIGDCFHCHDEFQFTVRDFRDIGLDLVPPDAGRSNVTGLPEDVGKFKIPTLRNIELTAPYMHDGRFQTLEEVLDHYDSGGVHSQNVDPLIRVGRGLGLTEQQKQDIIAFLKTLTDSTFVNNPDFSNPFE
ncbi:MAG: cytochrome-c peroxidase [Candidatus Krumholzibacteriia bacterium]